jgi:hypothetical protein
MTTRSGTPAGHGPGIRKSFLPPSAQLDVRTGFAWMVHILGLGEKPDAAYAPSNLDVGPGMCEWLAGLMAPLP